MKAFISILLSALLSATASAGEFWTVRIDAGITTSASGNTGINIGQFQPTDPNPATATWAPCNSNWIYFHKKANGELIEDKFVDRMLSVAIAAYKTKSRVRVSLERDASGNCYTSQIFDMGG